MTFLRLTLTFVIISEFVALGKSLTITEFKYDYVRPTDVCRSPQIMFQTPSWDTSSTFRLSCKLFRPIEKTYIAKSSAKSSCNISDKSGKSGNHSMYFGCCIISDLYETDQDLYEWNLTQTFANKTVVATQSSVQVDYIKKRLGKLIDFKAHASNTSSEVIISWTQQWPNCKICNGLKALSGHFKFPYELCSKGNFVDCKPGWRQFYDDQKTCVATADGRRQRCSKSIPVHIGTTVSFRLQYSFLDRKSDFTNWANATTLREVPVKAPEVNCTIVNGYPSIQWKKPPTELLLSNYENYKLRWMEKKSLPHIVRFPLTATRYRLKNKLQQDKSLLLFLDICTIKGCTDQTQPCPVIWKNNPITDHSTELPVNVTIMIIVLVCVVVFLILIAASVYGIKRGRRYQERSSRQRLNDEPSLVESVEPRDPVRIVPYITSTYDQQQNCEMISPPPHTLSSSSASNSSNEYT